MWGGQRKIRNQKYVDTNAYFGHLTYVDQVLNYKAGHIMLIETRVLSVTALSNICFMFTFGIFQDSNMCKKCTLSEFFPKQMHFFSHVSAVFLFWASGSSFIYQVRA